MDCKIERRRLETPGSLASPLKGEISDAPDADANSRSLDVDRCPAGGGAGG